MHVSRNRQSTEITITLILDEQNDRSYILPLRKKLEQSLSTKLLAKRIVEQSAYYIQAPHIDNKRANHAFLNTQIYVSCTHIPILDLTTRNRNKQRSS